MPGPKFPYHRGWCLVLKNNLPGDEPNPDPPKNTIKDVSQISRFFIQHKIKNHDTGSLDQNFKIVKKKFYGISFYRLLEVKTVNLSKEHFVSK